MSANYHHAWSTASELAYISNLGRFSEHTQPLDRHDLLKNYFHAMQRRARWDGLDRTAVLKAIFQAMMDATAVKNAA